MWRKDFPTATAWSSRPSFAPAALQDCGESHRWEASRLMVVLYWVQPLQSGGEAAAAHPVAVAGMGDVAAVNSGTRFPCQEVIAVAEDWGSSGRKRRPVKTS
jgi:hypothetical protein